MTILQCTLSLVLLLFFSEASALITISIPKIIVSGQPFQVTWTRSATDPTSFFVELLQDGTPVTSIPTGAKGTSGVVQIPQLILNPGSYTVRATDASGGGNILGESNVFEIVGPVVSSSTPLPPSSAVTGFTPSQTTPKATQTRTVTEDSNSPHSSSSTVLTGPISTTVDSISSTSASVTAQSLPVTSGSGTSHLLTNPGSKTTISVISVSSPSPSRFVSNQHPAASKLPIIIGCVVAVLVVCISLTFLLCYLRRRSRQNQNQEQDPVSPFADYTVSTPWVPGKVREPFTTSNADSRTSNTKTGTTFHPSPGNLPEITASGTVIEAPDNSLRDNDDAHEEVPLEAAVEIERLRLENRVLRRQIESSSPVGETLPPSYPGSEE